MKFLEVSKDGGPESTVWAHWLVELKSLFSIALLRFEGDSREAYHDHAFDSISWVLSGGLIEDNLTTGEIRLHVPSLKPVFTYKNTFHKVDSVGRSWVLSIRGPWSKNWHEFSQAQGYVTLSNGRIEA